ncbi:MAG: hypothetical protein ACOC80_13305 [Petrotogales bacterium]
MKLRNIFKSNKAFAITGTLILGLVFIVGGFLFMSFLVTQIMQIAQAMAIMGIAVFGVVSGIIMVKKLAKKI